MNILYAHFDTSIGIFLTIYSSLLFYFAPAESCIAEKTVCNIITKLIAVHVWLTIRIHLMSLLYYTGAYKHVKDGLLVVTYYAESMLVVALVDH